MLPVGVFILKYYFEWLSSIGHFSEETLGSNRQKWSFYDANSPPFSLLSSPSSSPSSPLTGMTSNYCNIKLFRVKMPKKIIIQRGDICHFPRTETMKIFSRSPTILIVTSIVSLSFRLYFWFPCATNKYLLFTQPNPQAGRVPRSFRTFYSIRIKCRSPHAPF